MAARRPRVLARRDRFERTVLSLASCPETDSHLFQAAVLLVCAREVGQNVDKLAAITGYGREFVARCARRLYDNGVWQDGETITAWQSPADDEAAFWSDSAVAEGKLCRRRDGDGQLSWAPAGSWWKSFDYRDTSWAAKAWLDVPEPPLDIPAAGSGAWKAEVGDPVESGEETALPGAALRECRSPLGRDPRVAEPSGSPPRDAGYLSAPAVAYAASTELFPDAVWLK